MGVEAAVGPHRELSPGPAVAHPPHRLTQEVGRATGGVGPALAQPGHQHLAGAGGNGQQRVIAAGAGIAVVARSLLGQSIGLADGRVQVDAQGRVAGSGPSGPGPGQQLAAHAVELTEMPRPEAAQEGPQGGWRLDHAAWNTDRPTSAQRIGVVDAVAAYQRGSDQRQHLVPSVRPVPALRRGQGDGRRVPRRPRCRTRVAGRSRPALATRRWSSKRMRIRSGLFCGSIYWVLLVSGRVSVPKPLSQIQRSTRWLLQGLSPRTSFGGFGLREEIDLKWAGAF